MLPRRAKVLSALVLLFMVLSVLPLQAQAGSVPHATGLILEPKQVTLEVGQSCQIKAVVTFSDGRTVDAARSGVWYVSNARVVSFRSGKVTALSPGTATVQVRSCGRTGAVAVTVVPKQVVPTGIAVEPKQVALEVGQSCQLRVTLKYSDGTAKDVTAEAAYSVIGGSRAVSASRGRVTALAPGSAAVVAACRGRSASVAVMVKPKPPKPVAVSVEPADLTLEVGRSARVKVTLKYSDGTAKDVTGTAVYYVVGDKSAVAVDKGAITGLKPGKVTVMAISQGYAGAVRVTVVQPRQEGAASGSGGSASARPADQGTSAPQPPASGAAGADQLGPGEVPAVEVAGPAVTKTYRWEYQGRTYTWQVDVPQDLLAWSNEVYETTKAFFEAAPSEQFTMLAKMAPEMRKLVLAFAKVGGVLYDPAAMVRDSRSAAYAEKLAGALKARAEADGYGRFETAEFALKFVQSVPYGTGPSEWYPELPARVLVDQGDCDGKSVLLAAVLRSMGYDVALLYYSSEATGKEAGHMAVGVSFDRKEVPARDYPVAYYQSNGRNYYIAETTAPVRIGERNGLKVTKIYPIN